MQKTLQLELTGVGNFVTNGHTTFTFQGNHPNTLENVFLCIHQAYVDDRRDLVRLSLLQKGDVVTFDIVYEEESGNFIHVDRLFSVVNH